MMWCLQVRSNTDTYQTETKVTNIGIKPQKLITSSAEYMTNENLHYVKNYTNQVRWESSNKAIVHI